MKNIATVKPLVPSVPPPDSEISPKKLKSDLWKISLNAFNDHRII
jgi:hypothetical protein